MKTLHLVLTGHWYDKIASGEKTSEYRAWKAYWNKRFTGSESVMVPYTPHQALYELVSPFDIVVFHKGYTAETMVFKIAGIFLIKNIPNDLNESICWEIKLGNRIK